MVKIRKVTTINGMKRWAAPGGRTFATINEARHALYAAAAAQFVTPKTQIA